MTEEKLRWIFARLIPRRYWPLRLYVHEREGDRPRTVFALENAQGAHQHLLALTRGWDSFTDEEKRLGVEAARACLESSRMPTAAKHRRP